MSREAELLSALEELVAEVKRLDNRYDQGISQHSDEMEKAQAVIAKAKRQIPVDSDESWQASEALLRQGVKQLEAIYVRPKTGRIVVNGE